MRFLGEASAAFVCRADLETVAACVQEMKTIFAKELEFSDAGVDVAVKEVACDGVLCIEDSEEVITLLMTLPNGLRHHSMSIEGLSTASSNIGVVTTQEEAIIINASLRGAMDPMWIHWRWRWMRLRRYSAFTASMRQDIRHGAIVRILLCVNV